MGYQTTVAGCGTIEVRGWGGMRAVNEVANRQQLLINDSKYTEGWRKRGREGGRDLEAGAWQAQHPQQPGG